MRSSLSRGNVVRILVTGGSGFIGTNYIQFLLEGGHAEFLNLDHRPPRNLAHGNYWRECDLLDAPALARMIDIFSPTHVVHLAAECSLNGRLLSDYATNVQGVRNLLSALSNAKSVERVIFTS